MGKGVPEPRASCESDVVEEDFIVQTGELVCLRINCRHRTDEVWGYIDKTSCNPSYKDSLEFFAVKIYL
jgi:hypothetical protein